MNGAAEYMYSNNILVGKAEAPDASAGTFRDRHTVPANDRFPIGDPYEKWWARQGLNL